MRAASPPRLSKSTDPDQSSYILSSSSSSSSARTQTGNALGGDCDLVLPICIHTHVHIRLYSIILLLINHIGSQYTFHHCTSSLYILQPHCEVIESHPLPLLSRCTSLTSSSQYPPYSTQPHGNLSETHSLNTAPRKASTFIASFLTATSLSPLTFTSSLVYLAHFHFAFVIAFFLPLLMFIH